PLRVRLVAEDPRILEADRSVGGLHLRVQEGPLLKIERPIRAPGEGAERVVTVLCAETVQKDASLVGAAVAIGVFQEDEVGLLGHVYATVAEFESERQIEA